MPAHPRSQLTLALVRPAASVRETVIATCSLFAVTETVMAVIPGADCAAVVALGPAGTISVQAVRGDLPPMMMDLQNEIGQGPWLDALTAVSRIRVRDIRTDTRWPLFRERAAVLGALSLLCTPVAIGTSVAGALCLISKTAETFDDQASNLAAVFAEHAAIALADAEIMEQMHESLNTRTLIGQAKGIIMERQQLRPDAAVAMLARAAWSTRTTLRDVAGEVCRTGHLPENNNPSVLRPACPVDPDPHSPGCPPAGIYVAQESATGHLRITTPADLLRTGGASIRASAVAGLWDLVRGNRGGTVRFLRPDLA